MSLFPSYTTPPAVGWKASWLADEPRNRANPNNPLVGLDAIKSSQGSTYTMVTPGGGSFTAPSFSALDPLMNNRAAWVFDSTLDRVATYNLTAFGPYASSVMVVRIPQITGGAIAAYGMQDGATARWSVIQAGYSAGDLTWAFHGQGSYARFPLVRPIFDRPILVVTRLTASESSISVNGDTYTGATYSTDPSITSLGLGDGNIGGGEQSLPMRVGFYGVYSGDVTTDPQWSNFLDWVQSHYGFDPRATYASAYPNQPPPISWRAEYLADDFDASRGWPDRTDRGYTLNFGGVYIASDGLRNGGSTATSTNCAKVDNFAGLNFTGDFEVALRLKGSLPSSTVLCGQWDPGAAYPASRWSLRVEPSNVLRMEFSDGSTFKNMGTSTFPFLSGWESIWLRVAFIKNSGGNSIVRYYWSHDGSNWLQWGADVTTPTFSYPNVSNPFYIGSIGSSVGSYPAATCIQRVILKNGIGGTTVVDADFDAATPGVTSFTESANGRTVNILSSAPTKVANVVNGQPVVRFDGVDDYLKATGISLAAPFTTVAVVKATPTIAPILGAGNNTFLPGMNGAWEVRNGVNNSIAYGVTSPSNWNLLRMYDNGSTGGVFAVNETVLASGLTIGGTTLTDLYLATNSGAGLWCAADFAYVGVFYGDVTQSTLWSTFKTWVTNKYGITVA